MYRIKNISNNPLPIEDGTLIAPGETREVRSIGEKERNYEQRRWLRIFTVSAKPKPTAKQQTKLPAAKTETGGKTE